MPHPRTPERPTRRRIAAVRRALGLLGCTAVLAVGAVAATGAASPTCAAAAGQVRVAVVVDDGSAGGPHGLERRCVAVDQGASGLVALAAAGHTYRLAPSGLLCAIDGFPAGDECGLRTPAGYRYWAYFHGGTTWTYAAIGPAATRLRDGSVEGWHFVEGAGNPTDPPPAAPADAAALCGPPATTTSAPRALPQPPVPTSATGPVAGAAGGALPAAPSSPPAGAAPTSSLMPGPGGPGSGGPAGATNGETATVADPGGGPGSGDDAYSPSEASSGPVGSPAPATTTPASADLAFAAGAEHPVGASSSSGLSPGALVALVAIAVAGVAGVAVGRRRREESGG